VPRATGPAPPMWPPPATRPVDPLAHGLYRPRMRIVVLGAGFGGLELTSTLSKEFGDTLDLVLVDRGEGFVFGFSKLDLMFGRITPAEAVHSYRDVVKPGVRFVQAAVRSIDPVARRVETDAGTFDADILVVALGADYDPAATPGLLEGGHEFYSVAGATAVRDVLPRFGGGSVVIGITSTPFKCPPAPSETALLMHDLLVARGLRDRSEITLVMPFGVPIPPAPDASRAILAAFEEHGIRFVPERLVGALDPARRMAVLSDGSELPYDLFLGIPKHEVPAVVAESGMTVDGWIPVDSLTLETSFPGVYAVGDVTSVGTPKAGVFAEGQAKVVAAAIAARIRGEVPSLTYDGRGVCYVEFGSDQVAQVDVTFLKGQPPYGSFDQPSEATVADKALFGSSRVARWFGRGT
jgi:sulfide:quinone oxidoreductase